jgi:hypothetical protein
MDLHLRKHSLNKIEVYNLYLTLCFIWFYVGVDGKQAEAEEMRFLRTLVVITGRDDIQNEEIRRHFGIDNIQKNSVALVC